MRKEGKGRPEVAGTTGKTDVEDLLRKVSELNRKGYLGVANPMAVCGRGHAISAYMHAKREFERGTSVSREFSGEFLRYLTGERQISKAIEKGGIREGSGVIVVSEMPVDEILMELNLKRDDSLIPCSEEKARHLGLNCPLPPEEMALELVAMVAIL